MMAIMRFYRRVIPVVTQIITATLLSVAFVLGIGLTSFIAKMFGGVFLKKKYHHSSWERVSGSKNLDRMF